MEQLKNLAVGSIDRSYLNSDYSHGMAAIGEALTAHASEVHSLIRNYDAPEFSKLAPAGARLLLEQGLAAVLGRLDPVRFISIVRGASSPDFILGRPNASSFFWSKDVLPDVKPTPGGLWSQECLSKMLHRSMLDGHLADYLFVSAHETVITHIADAISSAPQLCDWIISLMKIEKGENVLSTLRKRASESYSTLSKGIHFEFFRGRTTIPEKEELCLAIRSAVSVLSTVGLYSHFSDISLQKIPCEAAVESFLHVVNEFECE